MEKLIKRFIIIVVSAAAVIVAGVLTTLLTFKNKEVVEKPVTKNEPVVEKKEEPIPTYKITTKDGYTYVENLIVVNKKYSIPNDHNVEDDPVAKVQLIKMIEKMNELKMDVNLDYGGARSYETQAATYENAKKQYGEKVDFYEAKAGFSERETGFTFDLYDSHDEPLSDVNAIDWLNNHAHEYGFIMRLPLDKENITGFYGKLNRVRYVGDIAKNIYESKKTFEEFFNLEHGEYR